RRRDPRRTADPPGARRRSLARRRGADRGGPDDRARPAGPRRRRPGAHHGARPTGLATQRSPRQRPEDRPMTATLELPTDPAFPFRPRLDPVQLSVLAARLSAVSVEMAFTLRRTSRSLYVKEGGDFSASLLGLHGQLLTIPEAAGSPMFTILDCTPAIEAFDDLGPGDVIITND